MDTQKKKWEGGVREINDRQNTFISQKTDSSKHMPHSTHESTTSPAKHALVLSQSPSGITHSQTSMKGSNCHVNATPDYNTSHKPLSGSLSGTAKPLSKKEKWGGGGDVFPGHIPKADVADQYECSSDVQPCLFSIANWHYTPAHDTISSNNEPLQTLLSHVDYLNNKLNESKSNYKGLKSEYYSLKCDYVSLEIDHYPILTKRRCTYTK